MPGMTPLILGRTRLCICRRKSALASGNAPYAYEWSPYKHLELIVKNRASRLSEFQAFLVRTFNLVKPYWVSDEKRTAWSLLLSILAVEGVVLYLMTKLSFATAAMFNAIEQRALDVIWNAIAAWGGFLSALLVIFIFQVHVQNKLIIHWRRFFNKKVPQRIFGQSSL